MAKLLQVDFQYNGPYGKQMADALVELAKSINDEPGMIWKIWTESELEQLGGGIYLFTDETSARNYLAMHSARLKKMGIDEVRGKLFDVNEALTLINKGPLVPA
ncbi:MULTISPECIES: monooxygenase [unclassified Pseudoalteromonas]|uniref:monooxygenase n=1 Tax=unclassified Pseudoalteromonas TaxID=194690 RepID=UPI000CF5EE2A|nr:MULTISPECIES: monooxygenase [unclassified Pseudoalteromonas]